MKKTVAAELVKTLIAFDTEYCFQLTGGDQPLWIALRDAGIKMVLGRSEPGSVYMADGYARASGKPGLTYGQAGPGAANVAAALADAYWAQSPVVAITGADDTNNTYKNEYQSINQHPMFEPVTKWSGYAANPARVPDLMSFALSKAMKGNKGPTHVDIPKNYFGMELPNADVVVRGMDKPAPLAPDNDTVAKAVETLLKADKPLILIGDGALQASAEDAVTALTEGLGIPVVTTMSGKTVIPSEHPQNLGVVGRYSSKTANELLGESDCVLVIGSRMGGLATKGFSLPTHDTTIIMIDSNPEAFDANYNVAIKILGDARLSVEALNDRLKGKAVSSKAAAWSKEAFVKNEKWRAEVAAVIAEAASRPGLSPIEIVETLSGFSKDITIVADTGYMAAWTGVLYKTVRPNSYFRAIGSLGWAFPASLGVQMARDEQVVCVTGDGGMGYHLSEIETAVRMKIPSITVVMNNSSLAFEYHEQKYRHGNNVVAEANDLSDVDYGAVARIMGAEGVRVTTNEEFRKVFTAAMDSDMPTVIDVVVDKEAFPPVVNFDAHFERRI